MADSVGSPTEMKMKGGKNVASRPLSEHGGHGAVLCFNGSEGTCANVLISKRHCSLGLILRLLRV